MAFKKWLWSNNASDLVAGRDGEKQVSEERLDAARARVRKLDQSENMGGIFMKLSDLCTPKSRRATGKLSLDLLKITGKVAVAGTTSLVGAMASAAAGQKVTREPEDNSRMLSYGRSSDGIGSIDTRRD